MCAPRHASFNGFRRGGPDANNGSRMNEAIRVEIYSRPGCHLCDEAKAVIESVGSRHRLDVRVINIENDPELEARYGTEIPVVFINGRKSFKYRVDSVELERRLRHIWNP